MKALVLAGGLGSRLRPLTHAMPKQLVPVANKPVLFHALEAIRDAGVTEVGIVVAAHDDAIRRAVRGGSAFGIDVTYISQESPKGLAHCVMIARDFLGDAEFLLYLGDVVVQEGLGELVREYRRLAPDALVLVSKVDDATGYGVAEVDADGRVTAVAEKPTAPRSDLALAGAYVFGPDIHDAVHAVRPSWRNEHELTHAIALLVERGFTVRAHTAIGYWCDTGRVADLLDCNRVMLGALEPVVLGEVDAASTLIGPVVVDASARVIASTVRGPAVIGLDARVERSVIGPFTSVGDSCEVTDSDVEDSVLMDGVTVRGARLAGSLLGRECLVEGTPGAGGVLRLLMGDDSRLSTIR